jgi:hypothetical protein
VDFGRLDEALQERLVQRVAESAYAVGELDPDCRLSMPEYPFERIQKNRAAITAQFSLDRYAERLWRIYQRVAASPTTALRALDGQRILQQFLAPERLWLLRT